MAYRGGHARREEIARLLGFGSYREQERFRKESSQNAAELGRRRESLQRGGQLSGKATPKERVQRVFREPDGRFVRTNREAELASMFRATAEHDGRITTCIVTIRTDDGPAEIHLWERGGIGGVNAWRIIEALRAAGVEKPALSFIVEQLAARGAGKYLGFEPDVSDVLLVQMGAEW